jgi:hypothetical protein
VSREFDNDSVWDEVNMKKGVVCPEKKPQYMGILFPPSGEACLEHSRKKHDKKLLRWNDGNEKQDLCPLMWKRKGTPFDRLRTGLGQV